MAIESAAAVLRITLAYGVLQHIQGIIKMEKSSHTKNNSKKATVLNAKQGFISPKTFILGLAILTVAFGAAYFITNLGQSRAQTQTASPTGAAEVRHPVRQFDDGKAHYFSHQSNGMTIRYFVLKSSDGIIRAAFDACDVCWQAGKGYYQDGDEMVCRNCGRRFASVRINEVKGGCNPAPLNRRIEKDQLVIQVDDILEGHTYFKGV